MKGKTGDSGCEIILNVSARSSAREARPELFFEIHPGADTKALSVLGYELLIKLAGERYGQDKSRLRIARGEHGKPFFPEVPGLHFSLSHSGEALALAIHDSPVGVDTERLREPDMKIARRFFAPGEREYIMYNVQCTVYNEAARFFEVWTKKEAYLKYTGEGLSRPLSSFSVLELDDVVFETQVREGYIISLCFT